MADGLTIDVSEVNRLAASLEQLATGGGKYVRDALFEGAELVRDDWRQRASGIKGFGNYPSTIIYKADGGASGHFFGSTLLTIKIGPDAARARRQGSFGGIIETGSPRFAPRPFGRQSLEAKSPEVQKLIEAAIVRAQRDAGFGAIVLNVLRG